MGKGGSGNPREVTSIYAGPTSYIAGKVVSSRIQEGGKQGREVLGRGTHLANHWKIHRAIGVSAPVSQPGEEVR